MRKLDWVLEAVKAWAIFTSKPEACAAACMAAQGPACDCQCGGANHGRAR
jgi:hypothetical protein